ncbi:RNA-binding protein [Bradyrhizobium sp. Gha]|uniref:RNA-binding protein n=1 Tax=Bradyrhizobium sp. Gha TaxID=1855318 RepID=UPI000AFBF3A7|nr:RNA-binding protein [Bradyrhizobium sp. Gha]
MLASTDNELDHGPRAERSATMRMCAVSREVRPIDELIRFVVSPTGDIVPDLKRKLPGRGMWVTASRQVVAEALRRHQFTKAFKRDLRVSPTLPADIEALLVRSVTEALGIAAKARQIVAGFGKVESALREGTAEVLIHASDGAADGIRKLDMLARQKAGNDGVQPSIPVVTALNSEELDLALTRSNVIHAALLAGPASKSFLSRSQMLVRYRMADADKTAEKPGQDF